MTIEQSATSDTLPPPSLWEEFRASATEGEFFLSWLKLQASMIPDGIQGRLVLRNDDVTSLREAATWSSMKSDPRRLDDIFEQVFAEKCGFVMPLGRGSGAKNHYAIAYPVLVGDSAEGAVGFEVAPTREADLTSAMTHLQWGISWVESYLFKKDRGREETVPSEIRAAFDLLAGILSRENFDGSAMFFVTELATMMRCERVSLAFEHKKRMHLHALSHSAQFGKKVNLVRAIETAMEEAALQRAPVVYPPAPGGETLIVRNHRELASEFGSRAILTFPLYGNERYYGALTLERAEGPPFTVEESRLCGTVAALAGPVLQEKRLNDRPLPQKVWDSFREEMEKLFGPRHAVRKVVAVLAAALAVFLVFAKGDYRLAADASLEGLVRRVVVAPFNGYVDAAPLRAGDLVEEGAFLCSLDDRDLRLERLNWLSQRSQLSRQQQEAMAAHDRAQVNIIGAQLDQAEAKFLLAESNLERTRIRAPFRGIILNGDLSQRLGGAVEEGETLFEVAPLDAYRLILEVDERRVADVSEGQRGQLILTSLPEEVYDFTVEKMTPISTPAEGKNTFRVEAMLDTSSERLRPGMEGVGKIYIDRRNLAGIWTRDMTEWFRLWLWSWWP